MRAAKVVLQKGFTLVELVIVIIILSALGIATSSYIATGVDIYTDITERDKSLNSVRFVMERLRREVSSALPNSAIVTNGCLTFTPIIASSLYNDFPIAPLSASVGTIAPINDYSHQTGDKAVVYLLAQSELSGSDKVQPISAINAGKDTLNFGGDVSFSLASPAKRVYIIRDNITYYFSAGNLLRGSECVDGVLMANNISGSFSVSDATLQRNGLVQAIFTLDFDGQEVSIEQTLHISNVP